MEEVVAAAAEAAERDGGHWQLERSVKDGREGGRQVETGRRDVQGEGDREKELLDFNNDAVGEKREEDNRHVEF